MGRKELSIIAPMMGNKYLSTFGTKFPKKYPASVIPAPHINPPKRSNMKNVFWSIFPTPARMGIIALTTGRNLASIMLLTPCFSKNARAISIFFLNFDTPWKHFSDQTQSFLHGRLDANPLDFDKHDYVIKDGKYYWPEGPFPSVLLLPFQFLFGSNFQQGIMQLILIVILLLSLFKLARIKEFNFPDSLYLTAAFLMGSPVVGLIVDPKSWFFAQVVTVTTLTLLLLELETKRRLLLIGILEAALIATRPTSGFIILALVVLLYIKKEPLQRKINRVIPFLIPLFINLVALMWFNYARFGNLVDNGYLKMMWEDLSIRSEVWGFSACNIFQLIFIIIFWLL